MRSLQQIARHGSETKKCLSLVRFMMGEKRHFGCNCLPYKQGDRACPWAKCCQCQTQSLRDKWSGSLRWPHCSALGLTFWSICPEIDNVIHEVINVIDIILFTWVSCSTGWRPINLELESGRIYSKWPQQWRSGGQGTPEDGRVCTYQLGHVLLLTWKAYKHT